MRGHCLRSAAVSAGLALGLGVLLFGAAVMAVAGLGAGAVEAASVAGPPAGTLHASQTDPSLARLTITPVSAPGSRAGRFRFLASFDVDGGNRFELNAGEPATFALAAGNYVVSEIELPDGWVSEGVTCDNGREFDSAFASVTLRPGDRVQCRFHNSSPVVGGMPTTDGADPGSGPPPPAELPNGGSGGLADVFQPGVSLWATLSALAAGLLFIVWARLQGLGRRTR